MRCLVCENFSFSHICKSCQELFLTPALYKRKLTSSVEVFSFYKYEDIKPFLHTKHTDLGYHIFSILAQNSFQRFAQNFSYATEVAAVGIDDNPKESYAHTAILAKGLSSSCIKPCYSVLVAKNDVSYSGKSKAFRKAHPRDFRYKPFAKKQVILVDDIITTGTTLQEAVEVMEQNNKEVLFCLTLASAKKS